MRWTRNCAANGALKEFASGIAVISDLVEAKAIRFLTL